MRILTTMLIVLGFPALSLAQPSFTESIYVVPADPEVADASAHELCFDEFRGTLLQSGGFVARNESEVEETVSGCTEDLSSPNYVQECMLNVATSQVDWVFMINVEDFGGGDFLLNGRGFQSATNAEVWSERRIVSYEDIRRAALDGCAQLGDDFLVSRGFGEEEEAPPQVETPPADNTEDVAGVDVEVTVGGGTDEPPIESTTGGSGGGMGYPEPTGSCPWSTTEPNIVRADMGTVTVNGTVYDVRGRGDRRAFADILESCGEYSALDAFERWRRRRRAVNGMCSTILFCFYSWIPATMTSPQRVRVIQEITVPNNAPMP